MLNLSGVNALRLPGNWFWQVGSVALRLYYLEASLKGSSLERFPTLSKKKKKKNRVENFHSIKRPSICLCGCYCMFKAYAASGFGKQWKPYM